MKKYLLFLLQGIIVFSVDAASGYIKGRVVEKNTGVEIPFMNVILTDLNGKNNSHNHNAGMQTDENGDFEFSSLCDGVYNLRVQGVGYVSVDKTVKISDGSGKNMNVELEEMVFTTSEVVVSATRNETNRRQAPIVVNVLSGKSLETINSCDLSQGLNYQSGLRVENNCQNCGFPQVRINGLEGPYSQILINSRPVLSALSGVYGLEQIPTNMIERIEVVRGGGSALFGSNAIGGTVNVITKDPISNSFQINTNLSHIGGKGWQTNIAGNVSLISPDNKYGIAMYQAFRDRHSVDIDGDGYSEIGKLNARNFGFRTFYRPYINGKISVEYHTTQELRRG